jgi:hypothetical protein
MDAMEPDLPPTRSMYIHKEEVMADDLSKRGSQDRSRISIHEDYEVRYWSKKFGVSAEKLKAAFRRLAIQLSCRKRVEGIIYL